MKDFDSYLQETGEIGYVKELKPGLVVAEGLPTVKLFELVMFETGEIGQIIGLLPQSCEIMVFATVTLSAGVKVVRTNERLSIGVGPQLLGKTITPLGQLVDSVAPITFEETRPIDIRPPSIMARAPIDKPLETGIGIVDMVIPLARGQRQLVIGDRKSGKSTFLLQTVETQAKQGVLCIYAAIGKRALEISHLQEAVKQKGIENQVIIIATSSSEVSGMQFLTPYAAMTIAEYFCEQGKETLVIMDDLTTHAAVYRELTLIARRFPGRSSYPGDIFYTHARLMERGGNYLMKDGNTSVGISVLPVAQSVMGDISAYITTNLMSMTDGHLFFDTQLFDQGRRPAVHPFLSVTRVGLEAQRPLVRDISRTIQSFLVQHEKLKQYTHFGAEVSSSVRETIGLGDRMYAVFSQLPNEIFATNMVVFLLAALWAGVWGDLTPDRIRKMVRTVEQKYVTDPSFVQSITALLDQTKTFTELAPKAKEVLTQRNLLYDQ